MQNSTLETVLKYIVKNKIELTKDEKIFLVNLREPDYNDTSKGIKDISLEDFITWYNSPLRNEKITKILIKEELSKKDFDLLIKLDKEDLDLFSQKYEELPDYLFRILLISLAKIKEFERQRKIKESKAFQILDMVPQTKGKTHTKSTLNSKINIVLSDAVYFNDSLIKKVMKEENNGVLREASIRIDFGSDVPVEFLSRYIELELDGKNKERSLFTNLSKYQIDIAYRRKRARLAVLKQDSSMAMNEVIRSAANTRIYQNKAVFDLIANAKNPQATENIEWVARHNRKIKDIEFMKRFASMSLDEQQRVMEQISEEDENYKKRLQNERAKPYRIEQRNVNQAFRQFLKSESTQESAKVLAKVLKESKLLKDREITKIGTN